MPSISCPDFLPISSFQNVFNYFSDNWLMVVDFTHVSRHYFRRVMDLSQFVSFSFQFYFIPDTCGGPQPWTEGWPGPGEALSVPSRPPAYLGLSPRLSRPGLARPEQQQRAGPRDCHVQTSSSRQVRDPQTLLLPAGLLPVGWQSVPLLHQAAGPRPAPRHQALHRPGALRLPRPRPEHLLSLRQLPALQQGPDLVLGALINIFLPTLSYSLLQLTLVYSLLALLTFCFGLQWLFLD